MLTRRDFLKAALLTTGGALLPAATRSVYPYIQNLRRRRATIVWKTTLKGTGAIEFSEDASFSGRVAARVREIMPGETGLSYPIYVYRADLTDLNPETEYRYRVLMDDSLETSAYGFRFRTAGSGGFKFIAFGDCGMGTRAQFDLAQQMLGEDASLALLLGDLVYSSGSYAEYEQRYVDYYGEMMRSVPFFPAPGNHDYGTQNAGPYLAMHALPTEEVPTVDHGRYYSFDWANVHFISLDTNASLHEAVEGRGKMLEWLEQDLQRSRAFWRIVYFHHPPYTAGIHQLDPGVDLVREYITPILDRHRIRVAFSGHDHSYQRSHPLREGKIVASDEGTVYVISGGGGANLYPVFEKPTLAFGESAHHFTKVEVSGAGLTVRAIRIDGQEIDRFTLAPRPTICTAAFNSSRSLHSDGPDLPVVTINGWHLSPEDSKPNEASPPRSLHGTRVMFQGRPLPLLYVSGTRLEVQLPHWRHWANLTVETRNGSVETDVVFSGRPAQFICR